jgi:hypothetical protein
MRTAEIRRQARADKITVRTAVDSGLVWALRMRREQPVQRAEMHRCQRLLSRVAPLAVELRHEPSVMLRDGDEVICAASAATPSATATPQRTSCAARYEGIGPRGRHP